MICVDTTFLVDLWRQKDLAESPAHSLIAGHPGEDFTVPAHAAGEFLEGGTAVSRERVARSLHFLRLFRIGDVNLETAARYARNVSRLRQDSKLTGRSKPDLWTAAWAVQHDVLLATRNTRHFQDVPKLQLIGY